MTYLMESKGEAQRLLMKSDEESTRTQLLQTGLRVGMTAFDAGGGAGFVTKIMSQIVGDKGRVILCDQSKERIQAAQSYTNNGGNLSFIQSPLEDIPVGSNSIDYVFCRFVFEYVNQVQTVFDELLRLTKPEGKLVIGDLDYNVMSHYPLEEDLHQSLMEIISCLRVKKLWDPFMGRKLYHLFYESKLSDIRVHMIPHHLIYGNIRERDEQNMQAKLDQVAQLTKNKSIELSFDIDEFNARFMNFFRKPERFSYTPLILVEGTK